MNDIRKRGRRRRSRTYFRTTAMVTGGPFRCYNCNKLMLSNIIGTVYEIQLQCPRCKAEVTVKCKEPIPFVGEELLRRQEAPVQEAKCEVG